MFAGPFDLGYYTILFGDLNDDERDAGKSIGMPFNATSPTLTRAEAFRGGTLIGGLILLLQQKRKRKILLTKSMVVMGINYYK